MAFATDEEIKMAHEVLLKGPGNVIIAAVSCSAAIERL